MNIKELLLSIPILTFVLWVFAAPIPQTRIERVCEPINWVGNLATSTTALSAAQHTENAVRWSDKLNYSCKYMVWRLFYQQEYLKAVEQGLIPAAAGANAPATPVASPINNSVSEKISENKDISQKSAIPNSAEPVVPAVIPSPNQ